MSTNENRISPDDPRLTAFALGELEGEELAQLEAELRADPAAQAIVAQIRIAADQFQAALAGETVEAAAIGEVPAQAARRGSHSIFRRFLTWGIPLAACLAVLLVREDLRRSAQGPESVVALSRPSAETAAKVPAPAAMFDRAKAVGTGLANNIGDVPSSVTVIDKQQLESTNAQNVNDIVMYEAGTKGLHTFTPLTGFGEKAADQGRVESPAAPAQSEAVALSPFEVNASQAKGTFTPNTTTGTRLNNNIGDIPSSITVVDKQQLENTNAQNIDEITQPMPAVGNPEGAQHVRPYIQDKGFIAGAGHQEKQGNPKFVVSTGRFGAAIDKNFEVLEVPVPNLGATPAANSLMFGSSGRVAKSYGQPSAASGLSGSLSVPQASANSAWIQSQIDRGLSFDQLTISPEGFSQPVFGDGSINTSGLRH